MTIKLRAVVTLRIVCDCKVFSRSVVFFSERTIYIFVSGKNIRYLLYWVLERLWLRREETTNCFDKVGST